jgi:hypothetical protein
VVVRRVPQERRARDTPYVKTERPTTPAELILEAQVAHRQLKVRSTGGEEARGSAPVRRKGGDTADSTSSTLEARHLHVLVAAEEAQRAAREG